MSNYDPFRIYTRSNRSSHAGQVLRKKYYPFLGTTFSDETISQVIHSLAERGFRIFPPGRPLPTNELVFNDLVYTMGLGPLELSEHQHFYPFSFRVLWDVIYQQFSPILDAPLSHVSNFLFVINILSINLYGLFNFSTTQGNSQFQFYFQDPVSIIQVPNGLYQLVNSNTNLISLQSVDHLHYLESYILSQPPVQTQTIGSSYLTEKLENTQNPYLYFYSYSDSSILPLLKSKDYEHFNPELYHLATGGNRNGPTIVNTSTVTFQVHLQYNLSS